MHVVSGVVQAVPVLRELVRALSLHLLEEVHTTARHLLPLVDAFSRVFLLLYT